MTVLITGGAIGDIPTILAAKELGHKVITSGNRPNDPGHKYSDEYFYGDYTNVKEIVTICWDSNASYIIPSCHDRAAITVSEVCEILKIPNVDKRKVAELIHNKDQLRGHMKKLGLNVPRSRLCHSVSEIVTFLEAIGKKVIVKPLNLTGGRGISTVLNFADADKAYEVLRIHQAEKAFIAEEFLEGSYHGFSTLIEDCKVKFFFSDTEGYKIGKFRVERTLAGSGFTESQISNAIAQVQCFAESLKLVDGILHCQTINVGGEIYILEICRRTPGDLYPWFCEIATGVNLSKGIAEASTGANMSIPAKNDILRNTCRIITTPQIEGKYLGLRQWDVSPKVTQCSFTTRIIGEEITNPNEWNASIDFFVGEQTEIEEIFRNFKPIIMSEN
jgi:phosphoribosylaminoimidazole carboxylase (NCAIR synthetase)